MKTLDKEIMDELDKEILIALLGSQPSIYQFAKLLKRDYRTVGRHILKMVDGGLITTDKGYKKDGKIESGHLHIPCWIAPPGISCTHKLRRPP